LEPILDSTFISDSFASRTNKGTHAALKRFDKFKRKVSRNGRSLSKNAVDRNMIAGWVLKADIKHYFDSVNHEILMKMIKRKNRGLHHLKIQIIVIKWLMIRRMRMTIIRKKKILCCWILLRSQKNTATVISKN